MKAIQIGVLLLHSYQWLDLVGPVDYIQTHSQKFLSDVAPPALVAKAPNITWHYVSESNDFSPIVATSGPPQIATTTFEKVPKLDYLIIPGADVYHKFPPQATKFIQTRFPELKALLTVCVGSLHLVQTGLLDGKRAATNKYALKLTVEQGKYQQFRNVSWVKDARFVVDGKIWTAAGVTAGLDLAAEFARVTFDPEVNKLASELFEYQANPARPDPFKYLLDGVKLD
ncbi:ThiJ/PfpI [Ephemerocybe angulata]|uniref:ThiJ/PfpI n=1 Tax=Ephemerocybe angulata TaxID=980116 RepID=A0A8H6HBU0_9AGAR|nr:ThiJ/PfpI [Tulosesus angulatus]